MRKCSRNRAENEPRGVLDPSRGGATPLELSPCLTSFDRFALICNSTHAVSALSVTWPSDRTERAGVKHIGFEVCYTVRWLVPLLLQNRMQSKRKCLALFCFALLSFDFSCVALLCLAELRLSVAVAVVAAVAVVLSVAVAVVVAVSL